MGDGKIVFGEGGAAVAAAVAAVAALPEAVAAPALGTEMELALAVTKSSEAAVEEVVPEAAR